ncbi:type II toxin-antitoxin system PemK/MazF family toxin [Candidatus Spongiisocius sp.]|uniref:type II toxin-antitoxin system PemK/MazF family toxin n=1 Tax=Candidatus Spongiisocius sp. TaxID=3101273 RepID=UPI003B5B3A71
MTSKRRGEVWWGEIEDLGRRPFLIMTRPSAIPVLNHLVAAPVTRTIRDIPTELRLGPDDGMPAECAASFDNIRVVPKALLVERICTLGPDRLAQACAALRTALAC